MSKKTLRVLLQVLLVISPLPLGCVGGAWLPACFLLFSLFAFLALLAPAGGSPLRYQRPMRILAIVFFVLLAFQLLPLPLFLLNWLSPGVSRILEPLAGAMPAFHPLSLIPAETALALARFLVYALFFVALLRVDWDKHDIFVIFGTAMASGVAQTIFGLLKLGEGNTRFFLFFMPDDHVSRLFFAVPSTTPTISLSTWRCSFRWPWVCFSPDSMYLTPGNH